MRSSHDNFNAVLDVLYDQTCAKYQGGGLEGAHTDRDGTSYRFTSLDAVPGTDLKKDRLFPSFVTLVLETNCSATRKKLHLLLNTYVWKDERGDLVARPALLRLELAIENETHDKEEWQRRDLQAYFPGVGPFRGLDLMEYPLGSTPLALELMREARELASKFPRSINLTPVRAAG